MSGSWVSSCMETLYGTVVRNRTTSTFSYTDKEPFIDNGSVCISASSSALEYDEYHIPR